MNVTGRRPVHERARPADGQRRAAAPQRRPAPGAGPGLRFAACDGAGPWSAWASALGGLGTVPGDGNAATLTYNFGGAAAGMDYRFDPRFLAGIGVGYTAAGSGSTASRARAGPTASASRPMAASRKAGFYVDALAGYAYYSNQLQRQIIDPRPAAAHRQRQHRRQPVPRPGRDRLQLGIYAPAPATLTPFGRLQARA